MGRSRLGGTAEKGGGKMIRRLTVIFASDDSEEALTDARTYLARWEYTRDDCKLIKRDGQILVIA